MSPIFKFFLFYGFILLSLKSVKAIEAIDLQYKPKSDEFYAIAQNVKLASKDIGPFINLLSDNTDNNNEFEFNETGKNQVSCKEYFSYVFFVKELFNIAISEYGFIIKKLEEQIKISAINGISKKDEKNLSKLKSKKRKLQAQLDNFTKEQDRFLFENCIHDGSVDLYKESIDNSLNAIIITYDQKKYSCKSESDAVNFFNSQFTKFFEFKVNWESEISFSQEFNSEKFTQDWVNEFNQILEIYTSALKNNIDTFLGICINDSVYVKEKKWIKRTKKYIKEISGELNDDSSPKNQEKKTNTVPEEKIIHGL